MWRRKFCNMSSVQMCVHNKITATRASKLQFESNCLQTQLPFKATLKHITSIMTPITKLKEKRFEHFKRKLFHDIYKTWSITDPQSDINDILRKQKWAWEFYDSISNISSTEIQIHALVAVWCREKT